MKIQLIKNLLNDSKRTDEQKVILLYILHCMNNGGTCTAGDEAISSIVGLNNVGEQIKGLVDQEVIECEFLPIEDSKFERHLYIQEPKVKEVAEFVPCENKAPVKYQGVKQVDVKSLFKDIPVIIGTEKVAWDIINNTHKEDYQPEGLINGKPKQKVKKVKNLNLIYAKYMYVLSALIEGARDKNSSYHRTSGCALSTFFLKKMLGEHSPMVSLIIDKLIEYKLIVRTKNYSAGNSASRYKLTPEWESKVCDIKMERFTRVQHGRFIENLFKYDKEKIFN